MRQHVWIAAAAFAVLTAGLHAPGWAAKPNTLTDQEKKDGWTLLFDGKTFDGWMNWKTKKPLREGGKWKIEDDALMLTGRGGGDLYTKEAYEHFDFYLEWRTWGNSGVFIRVDPTQRGAIYGVAPEIQVINDNAKATSSTSAGGLYALYKLDVKEKIIHRDNWNSMRVRIVDNKATHWFNGQKVYEYEIGSEDWNNRVKKSKFRKALAKFARTEKGHLGVQDHGAKVAFRNIKIRVLDKDGKPAKR